MALAAAEELAAQAHRRGLRDDYIVPRMDEWQMFADLAAATADHAVREGVAGVERTREDVRESARKIISHSREVNALLFREGLLHAETDNGKMEKSV